MLLNKNRFLENCKLFLKIEFLFYYKRKRRKDIINIFDVEFREIQNLGIKNDLIKILNFIDYEKQTKL